jgi:hypothetical protein
MISPASCGFVVIKAVGVSLWVCSETEALVYGPRAQMYIFVKLVSELHASWICPTSQASQIRIFNMHNIQLLDFNTMQHPHLHRLAPGAITSSP